MIVIDILNKEFDNYATEWSQNDYDNVALSEIARNELRLVKNVAEHFSDFNFEYNEADYEDDSDWWSEQPFSVEDFNELNITSENYMKADAVAFDMKESLCYHIRHKQGE